MFWTGNRFETLVCRFGGAYQSGDDIKGGVSIDADDSSNVERLRSRELITTFYYPIDPRLILSDVDGATRAEANADNDGWLFYHTTPAYHYDREVEVRAAIVAAFQPQIDQLLGTALGAARGSRALATRVQWDNLVTIRDRVITCAMKEARDHTLGWYQQNPGRSHLHEQVVDCINEVIRVANLAQDSTYSSVAAEVGHVMTSLAKHKVETRWDKLARLRAEADAKKKKDASGGNGD